MLKKFVNQASFSKFAINQLVYLEIYQSLSYGKQKVQITINRVYVTGNGNIRSIWKWV